MRRFLLLLLVIGFFSRCHRETHHGAGISGAWYYVLSDSVYSEVIFTNDTLWEYAEPTGTYVVPYLIHEDTLCIDQNRYRAKLTWKDQDEFVLTDQFRSVSYYRLQEPVDVAGLLLDQEAVLNAYVQAFRERKHYWEQVHRKSNGQ